MPFAETWRNLEMIILSAVSQTKINIIGYQLHVESKKKKENRDTNLWLPKGHGGGKG